jgi:hypothetical protein
MDRENVVYPYNEWMTKDKPWKHYANWKKPEREGHMQYDSIYVEGPE